MKAKTIECLGLPALLLLGCASDSKPPPAAPPSEHYALPQVSAPLPADSATRSRVVISPEIRRACGISDADANFAYDSSQLRALDYAALRQVAACFTSGPLAGRSMRLVGHADPRGGDEYNLVLGGQRADSVKSFLLDHGLKWSQVTTTSRGEIEAKGTDEASWLEDRRVDVLLAR